MELQIQKKAKTLNSNGKVKLMDRLRPNLIWILFVFLLSYMFGAAFLHLPWDYFTALVLKPRLSPAMYFTLAMYAGVIVDIFALWLLCWVFRKNRYIWRSLLLPRKADLSDGPDGVLGFRRDVLLTEDDVSIALYGRRRNSIKMLCWGLLLGFLTNFFCALCAMLHGDIKLYFDCSISQIPYFLLSLLCVCIQSSSEEWWCRGFLYERLHERYPLWIAIVINGVLFGLLHIFNPGASALPIIGITVCGISYALLRWYTDNIWIAMGIHTGWNFTQNFLLGLPNSGIVSEASVFHLDAANGMTNLIYDWNFGVEGGLPAVFIDALLGVVIIILAVRNGRIKELGMNREKTLALHGITLIDAGDARDAAADTPVAVE